MEKDNKQEVKEYKPGDAYEVPAEGSLGLLALGYKGLKVWREAQHKAKAEASVKKEAGAKNTPQ